MLWWASTNEVPVDVMEFLEQHGWADFKGHWLSMCADHAISEYLRFVIERYNNVYEA